MNGIKNRRYCLDGDTLDILFRYNKEYDMHFGEYPDFSEEPRYTKSGKPWVNSTFADCPHSSSDYGDCGSCEHFLRERENDLIGICVNSLCRLSAKA